MCVDENGVDMEIKENSFDALKKLAESKDGEETTGGEDDSPTGKVVTFSSKDGNMDKEDTVDPEESKEVLLIVVVVIAAVILTAILVIIITHYVTKGGAKTNKVTVLNTDGL